jgi:transposase
VLERIYEVSLSTTRIYDGMMSQSRLPFDFAQLEEEVRIELDLLEDEENKIRWIEIAIAAVYQQIDPEHYLMSPQGIGKAVAPAILGIIGDVSRFPSIDAFRGYFGFVPKKNQSSSREKKGLRIRKAAQSLLKKYMFLAAETARRYDPEFAVFYDRLIKRGLHHYQAVCTLANKMAGRLYALLKRMQRAENTGQEVVELSHFFIHFYLIILIYFF